MGSAIAWGVCSGASLAAAGSSQAANAPLGPTGGANGNPQPTPGGGMQFIFPIIIGFMLLMIFTSISAGRKEKKRRAEMMSELGRHDRVQTAGGLIGTVVEIKDNEIRLKIDETSDVKVWFNKDAVTSVLKKGRGGSLEPVKEEAAEA